MTQHVEIIDSREAPEGRNHRWQPVVGAETVRLLDATGLGENAQHVVRTESSAVLARCAGPTEDSIRTGLVVGYVQSGKTLSFTTLAAMARDNGFPLIILLAGTKKNLHEQTASRLARDLAVERPGGMSPWALLSNPQESAAAEVAGNIRSMISGEASEKFRRCTVLTVMKNPSRLRSLRNLVGMLSDHGVDVSSTPVLVIDDEADQAGLNAAQDKNDDATATYQAIVDLRGTLPRHSYLMYTATPQANLLINIADVLSPDFVTVLTPGGGYTGGKYFFQDHRDRFVRMMSGDEVAEALSASREPPQSLQRALATYFLVVAQRGSGPVSMLVHPSHTKDLHETYGAFVSELRSAWVSLLSEDTPDRDELVESIFRPAYEDLSSAGAGSMQPLPQLLREMPQWLSATQVRVVNSEVQDQQDIRWDAYPSWILVGGNKLDRGFTVEGLAVTYMPRSIGTGQVDSIQQRARFFGYKSDYAQFCRAWISGDTVRAFEHYVEHEQLLRTELHQADADGISLKQWKRKMLLDPAFKPTRKAVVDLPYFHDRIRGDGWMSVSRLPADGSTGGPLEALWDANASKSEYDSSDPRSERRNKRVSVSLESFVEAVLDWVTPDQAAPVLVPAVEDVALLNQLALLLRARADEEPGLPVALYLMDAGATRQRDTAMGHVQLAQGYSSNYPGDDRFYRPQETSVQLHIVQPRGYDSMMLGLRIRVPQVLAGGVLMQA